MRLQRGGDLAAEAARSLHPSAAQKGDTGLVVRNTFEDPLGDAAFAAASGAWVGPIALKNGWAVAKVVEQVVADEKTLPSERPILESIIRRDMANFQKRHVVALARKTRKVTVDEPWLNSLGKRVDLTEAELSRAFATIDGAPVTYHSIASDVAAMAQGPSAPTPSALPSASSLRRSTSTGC